VIDDTLPPHLAHCVRSPLPDDDELPPWLGQRMRDTTHHIIRRAALAAAQDHEDTEHD